MPATFAATEDAQAALASISVDMLESQREPGRVPCRFFRLCGSVREAEALVAKIQRERTAVTPSHTPRAWKKATIGDHQRNSAEHRTRY